MTRPPEVEAAVTKAAHALLELTIACHRAGLKDDSHAVDLLIVQLTQRFPGGAK